MRRRELPHPIEIEEHSERFSQAVTVLIVATTLLTAVVGFMQSQASRQFDEWGVEAQKLGVETLDQFRRARERGQADLELFEMVQEYRARQTIASQLALAGGAERAPGPPPVGLAALEPLGASTEQLSAIKMHGPDDPDHDPLFADRFFVEGERLRAELLARQDAANELYHAWKGRWTDYAASLAMFAVALYLFGVSLTIHASARYLLAGLAIALAGIGGVRSGIMVLYPPVPAPERAAAEYGQGMAQIYQATDEAGYSAARAHFDEAIRLRPAFALAYQARANAIFSGGQPPVGTSGATRADALESIIADRRKALSLGTFDVLWDLGWETLLRGLQDRRHRTRFLRESARRTREAIDMISPGSGLADQPGLYDNLALASLALGRADRENADAAKAYRDAVRSNLLQNKENSIRQERRVGGALADLELLRQSRPDLEQRILAVKEYLVRAVGAGDPDAPVVRVTSTVKDLDIQVFPAELQWTASIDGFDPKRDRLSVQWYYLDPEGRGWATLSDISGVTTPVDEGKGRYHKLRSYFDEEGYPPHCVRPGSYRVELYINGHLSAHAEKKAPDELEGLQAVVSPLLNVAMCRPQEWHRSPDAQLGVMDGYLSPDQQRGIFIFRYHHPRGVDEDRAGLVARYLARAVANAPRLCGVHPEYEKADTHDYLMGMHFVRGGWYRFEGGRMLARAGLHADGAIIVFLIFGPADYFDSGNSGYATDRWYRLVDSLHIYKKY